MPFIDDVRNKELIDCFLSEQILARGKSDRAWRSARVWHEHLADEPGLREAWDKKLAAMHPWPVPRSVGRHPGLDAPYGKYPTPSDPYKLSDGTDISRLTVDQIKEAQRKLSPRFPTIAEAGERRRRYWEAIVARTSGALCIAAGICAAFSTDWRWYAADAGFFAAVFVATCFYAGNRQHRRMEGDRAV